MGKIGFMLLGGAITIIGLGVLILIIMLVSRIQEKIIMHKIKKENNLSNQLAEAKELLAKWLQANICDSVVLYSETEQFLKDSEVEK